VARRADDAPIPVARLQPILERHYFGNGSRDGIEALIEGLAHRSGVRFATVRDVLRGHAETVSFSEADALLTAANSTTAWLDELSDLYEPMAAA
jgi:hypothetical protein